MKPWRWLTGLLYRREQGLLDEDDRALKTTQQRQRELDQRTRMLEAKARILQRRQHPGRGG